MTHKYRAVATEVNGIMFDSKAEARRYKELRLLEQGGAISGLKLQPRFLLQEAFIDASGTRHRKIEYVADFGYVEDGVEIIEDTKGVETPIFKLKYKLLMYRYPALILRITA